MPIHTFIVEIEVDRDSGLFASRDDINEKLEDALNEAENADLSGLGPSGDSEYSIQSISIDAVDTRNKAGRDALMEYDARVISELPGDSELRKRNKQLADQLKEAHRLLNEVKDRNIKLQEQQEQKQALERTRIWYSDPSAARRDEYRHYIPDGKYDRLQFQYGERDDQTFAVDMEADGSLQIRCNGWDQMILQPQSGNVVVVKAVDR